MLLMRTSSHTTASCLPATGFTLRTYIGHEAHSHHSWTGSWLAYMVWRAHRAARQPKWPNGTAWTGGARDDGAASEGVAAPPAGCGWRVDVCGSSAQIDGEDVGKGVGAGRAKVSRGQEKAAKGPTGRLQERAEPGLGEHVCACRLFVPLRGRALLAAPSGAVLSPRHLDGRRRCVLPTVAGGVGCLEGRL